MGTLIRRFALLVAALLVLTSTAAAAHVHGGDEGAAPLDGHSHSTCAYCVHAANAPEPAIGVSIAPPVEPLLFLVASSRPVSPAAALRSPSRGRAPPR